jgi:hypothetical protein
MAAECREHRGPHLTDRRSALGISDDLSRPIGSSVGCRKDCLGAGRAVPNAKLSDRERSQAGVADKRRQTATPL